jgi:hypothetical protein
MCLHDIDDEVSRDSLRMRQEYEGLHTGHYAVWKPRLREVLRRKPHPELFAACGVTTELLAYCTIMLPELLEFGYAIEHLIDGLRLTFADLRLLGFRLEMLRDKKHYPLIALYDRAQVRAEDLFSIDVGFVEFKRCVLDTDSRYARLLDINLEYWRRILGAG